MADEIIDQSGFTAALDAGKQIAAIGAEPLTFLVIDGDKVESKPFLILPDGSNLVDASNLLLEPQRIKAKASFSDLGSFISYVKQFSESGTLLLADLKSATVKAELDYHESGSPRSRLHSAHFTAEKSREWLPWIALDQKGITQADLHQFLHANRRDIISPDSATVLEAVRNLKVTETAVYERAEVIRTGDVQLKYQRSLEDRTKGDYVLPTHFTVRLRPFTNSDPADIELELRYRLNNDKLTFYLVFDRPDLVIEETFLAMLKQIEKDTGHSPLLGKIE